MSKETLDKKKLRGIKKLWFQTIFGLKKSLAGKKKDFGKKIFFLGGGGVPKKVWTKKIVLKISFVLKIFWSKVFLGSENFVQKNLRSKNVLRLKKFYGQNLFGH